MAGLFGLLWAAIVGGSAVGTKIEDLQCMKDVYTLPNGVQYYYDRKGKSRLMDGTLILAFGDGDYKTIDGRILYSKKAENDKRAVEMVRHNKFLYATQDSPRCVGYATVELSTGKIIAKVEERKKKDRSYEYRKWYFKELHPTVDDKMIKVYNRPTSAFYDSTSSGIEISAEEFNAINTCSKLPQQSTPAHSFCSADGETYLSHAYSKPWHSCESKVEERKELAKEFVDSGKSDGWYGSPVGTVYVEKGYVIRRKYQGQDEYPYTRRPGDRWYNVRLPYLEFEKTSANAFVWFPIKPSGNEYEYLDAYRSE